MSKIPQGEWNAIAARYQNGESISNIARSYGCTPPAIHYILKRNRQHSPNIKRLPTQVPPTEAPAQSIRTNLSHPPASQTLSATNLNSDETNPSLVRATAAAPAPDLRQPAAAPVQASQAISVHASPSYPTPAGQPASRTAPSLPTLPGLDAALHLRAEAAIETFRSSFDAALCEGSPVIRERLRQAATDLMRVAARTTIVLDRLNAIAERSARAHNYPRSAHSSEDYRNLGD